MKKVALFAVMTLLLGTVGAVRAQDEDAVDADEAPPVQETQAAPAAPAAPAPELAQLDRWTGEWSYTYEMPKSKAMPEGGKGVGTVSVKRAAGGHFFVSDSRSNGSGGTSEDHAVTTYDRASRQWKSWSFGGADPANPIVAAGAFQGDSLVMETTRGDAAGPVRLRETQKFVSPDRIEGKVEIEAAGKWHLLMGATYTRAK